MGRSIACDILQHSCPLNMSVQLEYQSKSSDMIEHAQLPHLFIVRYLGTAFKCYCLPRREQFQQFREADETDSFRFQFHLGLMKTVTLDESSIFI